MVIGRGMLAKAFRYYADDPNIIIFASGVSNSQEKDPHEFEKEEKLLSATIDQYPHCLFVYFSSCSIEDNSLVNSKYVKHKKQMEQLISITCEKYYIFRLPQVVGISKSPTIINFFAQSIANDSHFYIYKNATRNLIDVEDVFSIIKKIIDKKYFQEEIINIATPYNTPVLQIVNLIESILGKKANYTLEDRGEKQEINIEKVLEIEFTFPSNYTKSILSKYLQLKS